MDGVLKKEYLYLGMRRPWKWEDRKVRIWERKSQNGLQRRKIQQWKGEDNMEKHRVVLKEKMIKINQEIKKLLD